MSKSCVKSTCWDTRATDSIIKSGQKDTEVSIPLSSQGKWDREVLFKQKIFQTLTRAIILILVSLTMNVLKRNREQIFVGNYPLYFGTILISQC